MEILLHQQQKPTDHKKLLRWHYGKEREAIPAEIRNSKKGFIITSNNFLIEKRVFEQIHFREDIKKYGHEDTMLGYDLFKNNKGIYHINNPVEHTGLENSWVFIEKTKLALGNIHSIISKLLLGEDGFTEQVHFLNSYTKITRYVPALFLRLFYKLNESLAGWCYRFVWYSNENN